MLRSDTVELYSCAGITEDIRPQDMPLEAVKQQGDTDLEGVFFTWERGCWTKCRRKPPHVED